MARGRGARTEMALAFETTYGTAPGSGYLKLPFATHSLGAEQPRQESELLPGRDPRPALEDAIDAGGDIVVPIDAAAWGVWLKAAFGDPATTGTGPYTHVFASGAWSLPSMAIEFGDPGVPHFAMTTGCVLDRLSWSMQRSGLLQATAGLVAKDETPATSTGAGTPVSLEGPRFLNVHGDLTKGGASLGNLVSAEIAYANGLDRIETIRPTIEGADPTRAALTGQLVMRFADQTLLDAAIAGTEIALSIGYVRASGESFTLDIPRVLLSRPKLPVEGPGGIQASFDWQAAVQADGSPMCTATLINDVESYS